MGIIIYFCCPNLDRDISYLEALTCIYLGSWITIDRVDSIIVGSSHSLSAIFLMIYFGITFQHYG